MGITRTLAGLVGAAAVTTIVVGGSLVSAQVTGSPSDPRAEFIQGNVQPGDCSRVGGSAIPESAITFSIASGVFLTITAVDPAFTVIGIFVKGGDDTNLYVPGVRGLPAAPPWINLISPLTNGGQIPAISHWFACGTPSTTTTTTTTTMPTTTTSTTTTMPTTDDDDADDHDDDAGDHHHTGGHHHDTGGVDDD